MKGASVVRVGDIEVKFGAEPEAPDEYGHLDPAERAELLDAQREEYEKTQREKNLYWSS